MNSISKKNANEYFTTLWFNNYHSSVIKIKPNLNKYTKNLAFTCLDAVIYNIFCFDSNLRLHSILLESGAASNTAEK